MRTIKKLLIGLAVLAFSVGDARAQFVAKVVTKDGEHMEINLDRINEHVSHGFNDNLSSTRRFNNWDLTGVVRRPPGDKRWPGYKHIHLPAYLRMVEELDLTDNNLTSFIVPPGMVQLRTIKLAGNTQLTNLVLQQDTGVRLEQYWLENIERRPDGWRPPPASINVETRGGGGAWITIELGKFGSDRRLIKETSVPLKRLSAPEWMKRRMQYHGVTYETLFDIEHDWRPSGVELIRWDNRVIACWGPGTLQKSNGFPLEWFDVFCFERTYGEDAGEHRWELASERYAIHGEWSPSVILFRVRKTTGSWQDIKYTTWPSGEEKIRREWRRDCYRRPFVAPIPEVLITQP